MRCIVREMDVVSKGSRGKYILLLENYKSTLFIESFKEKEEAEEFCNKYGIRHNTTGDHISCYIDSLVYGCPKMVFLYLVNKQGDKEHFLIERFDVTPYAIEYAEKFGILVDKVRLDSYLPIDNPFQNVKEWVSLDIKEVMEKRITANSNGEDVLGKIRGNESNESVEIYL